MRREGHVRRSHGVIRVRCSVQFFTKNISHDVSGQFEGTGSTSVRCRRCLLFLLRCVRAVETASLLKGVLRVFKGWPQGGACNPFGACEWVVLVARRVSGGSGIWMGGMDK